MMQSSPAAMPKSPEAYQKRNSGIGGGGGGGGGVSRDEEDMLAKRMFHVDTLHVNKEKKWFFETVPNDYDYYPFGAPGSGAPLRNQNNEPVSRLPNINHNLWKRYSDDDKKTARKEPPNIVAQELKKREVLDMIETFANKNPAASASSSATTNSFSQNFAPQKRSRHPEHRYDPITRDHIRPETYWNDWFGRPGAGAPNMMANKKNLQDMLEPRGGRGPADLVSPRVAPYQPSVSASVNSLYPNTTSPTSNSKFRSNHFNNYEMPAPSGTQYQPK